MLSHRSLLAALALACALIAGNGQASAGIDLTPEFVVNTTSDASDFNIGAGGCDTTLILDGPQCSLRAAIEETNASPFGADILFDIDGAGPHVITPLTPLPTITEFVFIDGYSEPDAIPNTNGPALGSNALPSVVIDGENLNLDQPILEISAQFSTVRGLVFRDPRDEAILITADSIKIQGNFIGTDETGLLADLGFYGIKVQGDFAEIGGTEPMHRNVINASQAALYISAKDNARVNGNLIGTDKTGTTALSGFNTGVSIVLGATANMIGGDTPEERNIISGNGFGVQIPLGTDGNTISGNFIGTQVDGVTPLPNTVAGVYMFGGGFTNIGGSTGLSSGSCTGACNVISGNKVGVILANGATENLVRGNYIGVGVNGEPAGNEDAGIKMGLNSIANDVSGSGDARNVIAHNNGPGILVLGDTSIGNFAGFNSIHSNAGLGIDIARSGTEPDGPNENDHLDLDEGANGLQNYPVVTQALSTNVKLAAELQNGEPEQEFTAFFFANTACDPSGRGEGETPLGAAPATTDSDGNATFELDLPAPLAAGTIVTATVATFMEESSSEFSPCFVVDGTNATPTPVPTESATPTAAPTATPDAASGRWGDILCDGEVGVEDVTAGLASVAEVSVPDAADCPEIGDTFNVQPSSGSNEKWGDTDCDGTIEAQDSLSLLLFVAELDQLARTDPCPDVGDEVFISAAP